MCCCLFDRFGAYLNNIDQSCGSLSLANRPRRISAVEPKSSLKNVGAEMQHVQALRQAWAFGRTVTELQEPHWNSFPGSFFFWVTLPWFFWTNEVLHYFGFQEQHTKTCSRGGSKNKCSLATVLLSTSSLWLKASIVCILQLVRPMSEDIHKNMLVVAPFYTIGARRAKKEIVLLCVVCACLLCVYVLWDQGKHTRWGTFPFPFLFQEVFSFPLPSNVLTSFSCQRYP